MESTESEAIKLISHITAQSQSAAVVYVYARASQNCFSAHEGSSMTAYVYPNVTILGFIEWICITFPTHIYT
jgi:hypothetical protein